MSKKKYIAELEEIVGAENMTTEEPILEVYSVSNPCATSGLRDEWDLRPDVVVQAGSVEEVQKIMLLANKHKVPVSPGASYISSYNDAVPLHGGILLFLERMNQYWIDEQSRAITIEPGVTSARLWKEIAPKGYMLPYTSLPAFTSPMGTLSQRGEPIFAKDAAAIKGTQQQPYGIEFVTGLEVVLPTGEIVHTGALKLGDPMGQYESRYRISGPDLTDLFLGSSGAFGVITKLRTKLFPLPDRILEEPDMDSQGNIGSNKGGGAGGFWSAPKAGTEYVVYGFDDYKKLMSAMKQIEQKLPHIPPTSAMNWPKFVLTSAASSYTLDKPDDQPEYELTVILEKARTEDYSTVDEIVKGNGGARLSEEYGKAYLTTSSIFPSHAGPLDGYEYRWRFGGGRIAINPVLPPERFIETMDKILIRAKAHGIRLGFHPNIRGARPIMMYNYNSSDPEETKHARDLEKEITQILLDGGGSLYRGNYVVDREQIPRTGMHFELLKRFKKILDPNNIMSPGRLFPEENGR